MIYLIILIFFILIIEFYMRKLIDKFEKKSQWILNNESEKLKFEKTIIDKIFKNSFHKDLGWDRYPNQKIKIKKNSNEKLFYKFSTKGFRHISLKQKNKFAIFGDSFAFGSFVKDNSCWSTVISKRIKKNFINFAVPNYGFDQALLKYKNKKLDKNIENIIIGVVPETISRIQNVWKHYLEFGNIYGFKPRYILKNNNIYFVKNPLQKKSDFQNIQKIIEESNKNDFFYKRKYLKFKFKSFYLLDFCLNFNFNIRLFYFLIKYKNNFKKLNKSIFSLIYKYNIQYANNLYTHSGSQNLFDRLILKFVKITKKRKHKPIIIIFPQKYDIEMFKNKKNKFNNYFDKFKNEILVINLIEEFSKVNYIKFFQDDKYGGHLNEKGNIFVAKKIQEKIN